MRTATYRHIVPRPGGQTKQKAMCGELVDGPWKIPSTIIRKPEEADGSSCPECLNALEAAITAARTRFSTSFAEKVERKLRAVTASIDAIEAAGSARVVKNQVPELRLALGSLVRNFELELGRIKK